jgi:hypothetical protein
MASAAPLSLGSAADLVNIAIQRIWLKSSDLYKTTYFDKFMNVESGITDYYMKDSSMTGLGEATRITEQSVITSEVPVQGFDKTYEQYEFGKILPVTKRMWVFGIKKRDLTGIVEELRAACLRHKERLCADRLDNSFSTTYTVTDDGGNYSATISGGDSAAFISATHTREDAGSNWSNRLSDGTTVNMDLDYDALKAAHRTASLIKDGKGNLMNINLDTLVTRSNHTVYFRAMEMLGTIRVGGKNSMPGSADADAAGVPSYKILGNPYITTNTSYYWMFDSSMKGLKYGFQLKESQPIKLEGPETVFSTGEIKYKATEMYDIGFNDSRSWVGSKSTNTA